MPSQSAIVAYQPLIVGLGAVVLGLVANTILEWIKASIQNRHAADTLRRAILGELRAAYRSAEAAKVRTEEPAEADTMFTVPIAERYPIYDANVQNLGRLSGLEVDAVVDAYAYLRAVPETLIHIGQINRAQGVALVAVVPSMYAQVLTSVSDRLIERVGNAMAVLAAEQDRDRRSLTIQSIFV